MAGSLQPQTFCTVGLELEARVPAGTVQQGQAVRSGREAVRVLVLGLQKPQYVLQLAVTEGVVEVSRRGIRVGCLVHSPADRRWNTTTGWPKALAGRGAGSGVTALDPGG